MINSFLPVRLKITGDTYVYTYTYTVVEAAAKIGDKLYAEFREAAVDSMNDQTVVVLMKDIGTYRMTRDNVVLKVNANGHALTVEPLEDCILEESTTDTVKTYKSVKAAAKVGNTCYKEIADAVAACVNTDYILYIIKSMYLSLRSELIQ